MKKKLLSIILFLTTALIISSQEKTIEENYQQYFKLPREALFVHTNKTVYITKEDIWFQAYAYDRKNSLPSKKTTNIYLGLYDSIGNQIDKKLFLGSNGVANGNFEIDSLLPSGTYYLKATTNWMKNFKEDDSFVQKLEIINYKKSKKESIYQKKYDLQFLPEGGHLLSEVKNTVGFKFLNDMGEGTFVSGEIYDSEDNLITSFKSNALGMGKFSLAPEEGKKYYAKIVLENDNEEIINLPNIKDTGLSISVNNLRKDKVVISIFTNKNSFEKYSKEDLKLLIHRDGFVKTIQVKMDKLIKTIAISKKELFSGTNILTLVNTENSPILERLIFNNSSFEKFPLAIIKKSSDFDSIHYSLRSIKPLNDNETISLSLSVLPSETKSYKPNQNIITSLLIQPYIKGKIENPNFYFKNFGLKNQFELDILLLTQGWSKYTWDNINGEQPKPIYDFENGISFNGSVNSSLKNVSMLMVYPTKFNSSGFLNTDDRGKFNFNNYYLELGEEVSFSALMKNGKLKKPIISLSPVIKVGEDHIVNDKLSKSFISYYSGKNIIPENFVTDGYEALDEVTITVKKKERLRDPQFPNGQITQITENIAKQYPVITDFIQNNGFDVIDGSTNGGAGVGLGQIAIFSRGRGQGVPPVLFIDGVLIQDFNILQTITMDKVDRILIDRSGIGLGISGGNGFGGVIKITTRRTSLLSPNLTSPDIFTTKIKFGFEPTKEFYAPKYPSYRIKPFKNYGVIHWEPSINIANGNSFDFRTVNTNLDEITFFIEGMSSNGKLLSQIISFEKPKSN